MAARTNRSPSPLSSRPINQNPRNSEMYSATRQSFNGNNILKPYALTNSRRFDPVTPAASSPSDFSRRRSVGRDCEEKENNGKDQNLRTTKLHSSAKGSKHFMAPTISAASKFTPSPRKKPLVERNDPLRTSISLSDGKAMFFSNASEDLEPKSDMKQNIPASLDLNSANSGKMEPFQEALQAPKPSKKVTFSDVHQESLSDSVITDFDCSKMESFSKENNISCSPISIPIAPLDADPSIPPYDPKNNFLSPRPQFLYYRPNPRVEIFLNNEKGMGGLDEVEQIEDNLMSDENLSENSLSDSEGTEAYEKDMVIGLEFFSEVNDVVRDSRDSEEEKLEVIASSELVDLKFPKVVNGDIRVPEEDTEKEKLEAIDDIHNEKSNFVEKGKKKPWRVSRLVCFSVVAMMMLLMGVACVSLSVTQQYPSFGKFGFTKKDLGFSDLASFYHQSRAEAAAAATNAKVIFNEVARRVNQQLSVYSINFMSKVTDEVGKEETHLGPLKYTNLSSDLQMDSWEDCSHILSKTEVGENFTENDGEDNDELYEELDAEIENFDEEIEAYKENNDSIENLEEELDTRGNEMHGVIVHYVHADHLASIISPDQENEAEANTKVIPPETIEIEKSNLGSINNHGFDTALLDQDSSSDDGSLTEGAQTLFASESEFLTHYYAIAVSTLLAALLAFAAAYFSHYRRKNPSLSSANIIQVNNINNSKMKQLGKEDDDAISDSSCRSAMSSFQKNASSSYNNGKKTRKNLSKRESLASSSSEFTMGSPSYGSFTTFEKIPVKNANGEEEIITPVRRSNRIRNFH